MVKKVSTKGSPQGSGSHAPSPGSHVPSPGQAQPSPGVSSGSTVPRVNTQKRPDIKDPQQRYVDEVLEEDYDDEDYEDKPKKKSRKGVFLAIFLLLALGITWAGYSLFFAVPKQVAEEKRPSTYMKQYQTCVDTFDDSCVGKYIALEPVYVNQDKDKVSMIKNVTAMTKFHLGTMPKPGPGGKNLTDENGQTVLMPNDMVSDKKIKVELIDWANLPIEGATLKSLSDKAGNLPKDTDASTKLQGVFAQYVNALIESGEMPTKVVEYEPSFSVDDKGIPTLEETIKTDLDQALFSSPELHLAMDRVSHYIMHDPKEPRLLDEPAGQKLTVLPTGEVGVAASTVAGVNIPQQVSKTPVPKGLVTDENEVKNPYRASTSSKKYMPYTWVGAYANETKGIKPPEGKGIKAETLGMDTWVYSGAVDVKTLKGFPVKLKMVETKVDGDAINLFESRDARNRGVTLDQGMRFMYVKVQVKNLDTKPHTFTEQFSLANSNAAVTNRSGTIFGLKDKVTAAPGQTVELEGWVGSPTMADNYLIWGRDFSTTDSVVWFKQLKGSEGKVTIETQTVQPSDSPSESPSADPSNSESAPATN